MLCKFFSDFVFYTLTFIAQILLNAVFWLKNFLVNRGMTVHLFSYGKIKTKLMGPPPVVKASWMMENVNAKMIGLNLVVNVKNVDQSFSRIHFLNATNVPLKASLVLIASSVSFKS